MKDVGFYVISIYETHGEKGKGYHMYPLHMCHNTTENNTGKKNLFVIFTTVSKAFFIFISTQEKPFSL
jgi:hypothetical protein